MIRLVLILFVGVLLYSCTSGYTTENIRYDYLINDDNSKVWLIQEHEINGKTVIPKTMKDRQLMIFYASGKVRIVRMKNLGTKEYQSGSYYVNSDEQLIDIRLNGKTWQLKMAQISEDSLRLNATKQSEIKQNIKLVPLPEY